MTIKHWIILIGVIALSILVYLGFNSQSATNLPDNHTPSSQTIPAPNEDISNLVSANNVNPDSSTLLIKRLSDGGVWSSNKSRLNIRYSPASTSKIPHTLIALETGAANADTVFKWDGQVRTFKMWNQDQTLTTAFQRSAVWVFQAITTSIGAPDMAKWMKSFEYGNQDTGTVDDLTTYWLDGPLMISAQEQISFLERIVTGKLPLSLETYNAARPIFTSRQGVGWALYSKTGWYFNESEMDIGWFVGWLEKTGGAQPEIYLFAFNMDMPAAEDRNNRKPLVHGILAEIAGVPGLEVNN